MKKDPLIYLDHILDSIELINHYLENITEEIFKKDCGL